MAVRSDQVWFDTKWLEQTIQFENPSCSWKIIQKLQEHESRFSRDEYVSSGFYSESSCIFVCEETRSSAQAIMKVRMQIPNSVEDGPSSFETFAQPPEEQQKIRNGFKESYLECQGFGFMNLDGNITNLIWNKEKAKCYIIDWEAWSRKTYEWNDNEYRWWGLL